MMVTVSQPGSPFGFFNSPETSPTTSRASTQPPSYRARPASFHGSLAAITPSSQPSPTAVHIIDRGSVEAPAADAPQGAVPPADLDMNRDWDLEAQAVRYYRLGNFWSRAKEDSHGKRLDDLEAKASSARKCLGGMSILVVVFTVATIYLCFKPNQ